MVSAENFMKDLFFTYDVVRSYKHDCEHVAACKGIPQSLQPDGGLHVTWPTTFAAGSRSGNVDQFTKLMGIVATMDYSAIPPHLLDHVATKLAVPPLLRQFSCHVRLCLAPHHGWRGTVICDVLRATCRYNSELQYRSRKKFLSSLCA
jgi:hypothetical protein